MQKIMSKATGIENKSKTHNAYETIILVMSALQEKMELFRIFINCNEALGNRLCLELRKQRTSVGIRRQWKCL